MAIVASLVVHANPSDEPKVFVLPSLKLPIAVNCRVVPLTIIELEGDTEIEVRVGATKNPWHPDNPQIINMAKLKTKKLLLLGISSRARCAPSPQFL